MTGAAATARATTVPQLLDALLASDPGRPRITWYGPGGERIELSAKTLANWVAKTANLLVDDLDVTDGSRVRLALPAHWKTLILQLATSAAGGKLDPDGGSVDLLATADPTDATLPSAHYLLVVELAALARSFSGDLPTGALDYAAEVLSHDDVFAPCEPAVLPPAQPYPAGTRVAVRTDQPGALDSVIDVLRADGSVVLAVPEIDAATLASENLA